MNLELKKEGLELVKLFQETLNITEGEAFNMLSKNKTAIAFLKEELALEQKGIKKNLSALLSITLLRDHYDFTPLKEKEQELIDKYYRDYSCDVCASIMTEQDYHKNNGFCDECGADICV